jgi:hypothetical protein
MPATIGPAIAATSPLSTGCQVICAPAILANKNATVQEAINFLFVTAKDALGRFESQLEEREAPFPVDHVK